MKRLWGVLTWFAALALLQFAAVLPLPFTRPDPWLTLQRLSPDMVALLAVSVLGAAIGRGRWFAHIAALLLLAGIVHHTASIYVEMLLERHLDLKFDLFELPGVLHLLTQDRPLAPWMLVVGAGLALLAAELLLAWAFARAARPARSARGAVLLVACLQAMVLIDVVRHSCDRLAAPSWYGSSVAALAREVRQAFGYWLDPEAFDGPIRARLAVAAEVMAATPVDLDQLHGADVHLIVIESYGRYAVREPWIASRLRSLWQEVGPELQAAGFQVCTAACRPSNSGGESWLTHAQLLSATKVADRRTFQLLLESDIQPLPKRFQAAGYHTVEVMPAMPRHWPEGQAFYGFDGAMTQLELGYTGTTYHWGRMPDQFGLHQLLEHVVLPARQPLFTLFVSVTSHVPFRMVPPYIADWQIDASTFQGPPRVVHPVSWLDVPQGPKLLPAYTDTLEYSLRTTAGFVSRLTRPSLVIVLGDHQPPIANAGPTPDPSFDVPMHVIANRPELLAPLRRIGFVDGFELPESVTSFDTATFAPMFLRLYGR